MKFGLAFNKFLYDYSHKKKQILKLFFITFDSIIFFENGKIYLFCVFFIYKNNADFKLYLTGNFIQ